MFLQLNWGSFTQPLSSPDKAILVPQRHIEPYLGKGTEQIRMHVTIHNSSISWAVTPSTARASIGDVG